MKLSSFFAFSFIFLYFIWKGVSEKKQNLTGTVCKRAKINGLLSYNQQTLGNCKNTNEITAIKFLALTLLAMFKKTEKT